jgi:hypothetical protein
LLRLLQQIDGGTMSMTKGNAEETRIAHEIVSVLSGGSVARVCSDDHETIRFQVTKTGIKLRTVVLDRQSLNRLASDPARAIKIEYLQRDLLAAARSRSEFRYPRFSRMFRAKAKNVRVRAASLAVAALVR